MNRPNIPGFSSEASLYKTTRCYHAPVGANPHDGRVYPAQGPIGPYVPGRVDPHLPLRNPWAHPPGNVLPCLEPKCRVLEYGDSYVILNCYCP